MKISKQSSGEGLRGIAALFDDFERKELFKKYLFFLGWIEVLIFAVCWIYQLGDGVQDRFGPVEIPFPWKTYFLVAFLAPVAITFIIGLVVVGFNKYFAEKEEEEGQSSASIPPDGVASEAGDPPSHIQKIQRALAVLQQLPFLGLLLLLGLGAGLIYHLDSILAFLVSVGEQSIKIVLITGAVLLGLGSLFALILIVLNFQLRRKSMEYRYRSEMAERFGLIILEDNSVLNSEGKLLIAGKSFKEKHPLLPAKTEETQPDEALPMRVLTQPADAKTS